MELADALCGAVLGPTCTHVLCPQAQSLAMLGSDGMKHKASVHALVLEPGVAVQERFPGLSPVRIMCLEVEGNADA